MFLSVRMPSISFVTRTDRGRETGNGDTAMFSTLLCYIIFRIAKGRTVLSGCARRSDEIIDNDAPVAHASSISRIPGQKQPRQQECRRGQSAGQYSLGKWMTLLVKYRVISSRGKSVCSISFVKTILPLPSSHVRVAVRSGRTASFQT